VTDRQAHSTVTLPVHQYLTSDQLSATVKTVREFYES